MIEYPNLDMAGVELEGLWANPAPSVRQRIVVDGSVYGFEIPGNEGEIQLGPYDSFDQMAKDIRYYYPDRVNARCGMHVHVSVPSREAYEMLMSIRYRDFLLRRLKTWGKPPTWDKPRILASSPFWTRLRPGNNGFETNFCDIARWCPEAQAQASYKEGSLRYAFLNFCWTQHKTMEIRVLPMFKTSSVGISAIKMILRSTNRYLTLPSTKAGLKHEIVEEIEIPEDVDELTEYTPCV